MKMTILIAMSLIFLSSTCSASIIKDTLRDYHFQIGLLGNTFGLYKPNEGDIRMAYLIRGLLEYKIKDKTWLGLNITYDDIYYSKPKPWYREITRHWTLGIHFSRSLGKRFFLTSSIYYGSMCYLKRGVDYDDRNRFLSSIGLSLRAPFLRKRFYFNLDFQYYINLDCSTCKNYHLIGFMGVIFPFG